MTGRVRLGVLAAAAAVLLAPASATAQDGVFPSYRQSADDQYGSQQPAPQAETLGTSASGGPAPKGSEPGRRGGRDPRGGVAPDAGAGGPAGALRLSEPRASGLPFTGLDLTAVVLLGVLLVAAGAALRALLRVRRRLPV